MDNNINQIKRLYLSHDYTSLSILIVVECLIIFYLQIIKYKKNYNYLNYKNIIYNQLNKLILLIK